MKKYGFLAVCMLVSAILLCGCTIKETKPTINYQGRLKKYMQTPSSTQKHIQTIDLSEGPRLKYDGNLGPQDVNFDFKIKNPY